MLAHLAPAGVIVAEGPLEVAGELAPAETALAPAAGPARRRDLRAGRVYARQALAELGSPVAAVLQGSRGAPRWPHGVTGSITHTDGYAAAAVANISARCHGLGIDAEQLQTLGDDLRHLLLTPAERARSPEHPQAALAAFCAKEAFYKAWFPLTGRFLDYLEAEVALDLERGRFTLQVLGRPSAPPVEGRLAFGEGRAYALVVLPERP